MNFNEKLISLCKSKGLSQEELGAQLKVSRQTISKWESGAVLPRLSAAGAAERLLWPDARRVGEGCRRAGGAGEKREQREDRRDLSGRPHSKTLCQVVFGGRGNCRRRCPGAAPLFCSQRRLCLVKCGGNKAGSDRFPAFSLPKIKKFPSFFRINTQSFSFGNYKTKKCLLYSRNFAAYNKGKRERTGRFRTPAAIKKGGSEKST